MAYPDPSLQRLDSARVRGGGGERGGRQQARQAHQAHSTLTLLASPGEGVLPLFLVPLFQIS